MLPTRWVVLVHAFKPSSYETEAGSYLRVQGQPGLQNEFQHSQEFLRAWGGEGIQGVRGTHVWTEKLLLSLQIILEKA